MLGRFVACSLIHDTQGEAGDADGVYETTQIITAYLS